MFGRVSCSTEFVTVPMNLCSTTGGPYLASTPFLPWSCRRCRTVSVHSTPGSTGRTGSCSSFVRSTDAGSLSGCKSRGQHVMTKTTQAHKKAHILQNSCVGAFKRCIKTLHLRFQVYRIMAQLNKYICG